MKRNNILKWLPALIVMAIIFWFSAQPGDNLPDFDWADKIVKKTGHMLGYGILTFSYWYALGMNEKKRWLAWLFAVLYAMTDEFHQSFTIGRHASIWDVLIFDNLGSLIALWLTDTYMKQKRPDKAA